MKSKESAVQRLLSTEAGTEKISLLVPKGLMEELKAAYQEKVGAVREHGLRSAALFYFAARGVVDWREKP